MDPLVDSVKDISRDVRLLDYVANQVVAPSFHIQMKHHTSSIIEKIRSGTTTRKKERLDYVKMITNVCSISPIELTSFTEALKDELWITAMQVKLVQFERNDVWKLVLKLTNTNVIGT